MSLFNLPIEGKEKKFPSIHPWARTIKHEFSHRIKTSHNSVKNVVFPKPKEDIISGTNRGLSSQKRNSRITFTVIGNRVTKEFLYCVNLVHGMHKYKRKKYNYPVIKEYNGVEWENLVLKDLKEKYGGSAHCLRSQVAVICDDKLIGGEKELKEMIESKYYVNLLALNYHMESIKQFAKYIKEIGRPCAYLHFSINGKPIGSMIFMLYSDLVPRTCENFLRLCQLRKGGYSGTPVHRIVKDGWIQCGGFGLKNTDLDCENFIVPHDRRGVLAMANAGRHLDCSTQFFVLLQPNPCFKIRFVAFGQLIDGEETLKKIEAVETYYEAPLDIVIIYSAGVVNLECQDIMINKGAREYIEKHIDDLVIIGEMFYEMLLDNVFLEIEFRKLLNLNLGGEEMEEEEEEKFPENLKPTQRFIRSKEEQKQFDENERGRSSTDLAVTNAKNSGNVSENKDFDVDEYSSAYEPEHYSYSQVSGPSSVPKTTKPYYLALTDVPYPGEVDSTFDLKRFLKGDYCLEADLGSAHAAVLTERCRNEKVLAISEIINSYGGVKWCVHSSDSEDSSAELESDEENEIKNYLQQYSDKVSFSGHAVKDIAKNYVRDNPVQEKRSHELWNDEEIRRMRLALQDMKSRHSKKVSISVQPWETHNEVKRRMTGFVKAEDLGVDDLKEEISDDEDDNVVDYNFARESLNTKKKVSIDAPNNISHQIKRRQTGFVKSDDMGTHLQQGMNKDEENDENEKGVEKKTERRKTAVRIAPPPPPMNTQEFITLVTSHGSSKRRSIGSIGSVGKDDGADKLRPSVLMRLYEDIAIDDRSLAPTFKDYKLSITETKKKIFSLADDTNNNPLLRRGDNKFDPDNSLDVERSPTKRKSLHSKASYDEETRADQQETQSLRSLVSLHSVQYSRKRPSISVAEYKTKVKEEMEMAEAKKKADEATSIAKKGDVSPIKTDRRSGLRLPGDSPVYDTQPSDDALHSHGSTELIEKHIHIMSMSRFKTLKRSSFHPPNRQQQRNKNQ